MSKEIEDEQVEKATSLIQQVPLLDKITDYHTAQGLQ